MSTSDLRQPIFKFDVHKWFGLPLNIFLFVLSMFLMDAVANLRKDELSNSLQSISQKGHGVRSAGLVARYLMMRKKNDLRSQKEQMENEARLMTILSSENIKSKKRKPSFFDFLNVPGRLIINFVNFLAGKEPLVDVQEDKGLKMLEMAYFYERKRQFTRSIPIYNAALQYYADSSSERPYIFLHRGFGLALIGHRKAALADYGQVMKESPDSELAVTADILSQFLKDADTKILRIDAKVDSVNKGEDYIRVLAYRKAIVTLNKLQGKKKTQKLYYFRGQAYEQIGHTKKAVKDYKKAISININSNWAKKANRRLIMVSTFYDKNDKIKKEAKKVAIKLKDDDFAKNLENLEKVADVKKEDEVIIKDKTTQEILAYIEEKNTPPEELNNSNKPGKKNLDEITAIYLPDNPVPISERIDEKQDITKTFAKEIEIKKDDKGAKIVVIAKKPVIKIMKKPPIKRKSIKKKKVEPIITLAMILEPSQTPSHRRKLMLKKFKRMDIILTTEGDILVGAIISQNDKEWQIVTVYGAIKILRENIVSKRKERTMKVLK